MADVIEMPKLSDTMVEGSIVKWLKQEGAAVSAGDVLAEIETDKATMDLEAFDSGTLLKIVAGDGSRVACGETIAVLGRPGENIDEILAKAAAGGGSTAPAASGQAAAPAPAPLSAAPAPAAPSTAAPGKKIKASPLARKIAAERNVNLAALTGSGPGGRIVKKDVLAAGSGAVSSGGWLRAAGPVAVERLVPMSNMRRTIARRLQESKQQIPHFYTEMEVDMDPCAKLREELNARLGKLPLPVKLSFNDFVLKAAAEAMRQVPAVNASLEGDNIHQHANVDLAFGVAISGGLITPIIRNAQDKNLRDLSVEAKALAQKAKDGKLKPEEYAGGTFTVSNLGMFGVDKFSAIVNPPQAGILAVGAIVRKPVVNADGEMVIGRRLNLVLSADHRVVDGADGARFLAEVRALLENPGLLLV
jgi:pyruvate dehydrogenase E2 component (dihydrolipoamide acetyltransferase)